MPDHCPFHIDHENRIKGAENNIREIQKAMKSPAVVVAVIGLFSTIFSGLCAFAAVIAAPVLRAWLGY